jgi:predicted P-loop ATPase
MGTTALTWRSVNVAPPPWLGSYGVVKMQTASSAHVCTPNTPGEYIANLPAWDGMARLDTWLPHVLGESPESAGMHRMQYLSLVGRQWLLGMVRRALEPGCKFGYCLVLEGAGGLCKSTLLLVLAGKEFFSDEAKAVNCGQVLKEAVERIWLCEIVELSAYNKSDKAGIKAFITARHDYFRRPYQVDIECPPRQFVVAGTTNDSSWRKNSGPRRFWAVPVLNKINTEWVVMHRDQLFAEAKARIQEAAHMQELSEHQGYPRRSVE